MIEQTATYSPEDNKLRLYIGRVPREEFLKLRAEGWVTLHKQREAGGGDFAATWTPQRRDTALEYGGGVILDEDMGPDERAADRAERFGGYRDKRTEEAVGHADAYDAGPSAHGYQSQARAERAVARHDRIADRASDAWSKAEYWQRRTAGVINHALYKSSPGVRMGRIKTLEADLRRYEGSPDHYSEWITHTRLRLAYENQMLEAQGGRAAFVEMVPGGRLGGHLIVKVCKSPATGRVVSVFVKGEKVEGWQYKTRNVPGCDYSLHQIETERLPENAYKPPTQADLDELAKMETERKANKPEKAPCPLVNPTDADAERLQAILNERAKADHCARYLKAYGRDYAEEFKPSTVCRITQAVYSANSKGSYARAETRGLSRNGELADRETNMYSRHEHERAKRIGPAVCQVRTTDSEHDSFYAPRRVIILTDKPQKPLPAAVWEKYTPKAQPETVNA